MVQNENQQVLIFHWNSFQVSVQKSLYITCHQKNFSQGFQTWDIKFIIWISMKIWRIFKFSNEASLGQSILTELSNKLFIKYITEVYKEFAYEGIWISFHERFSYTTWMDVHFSSSDKKWYILRWMLLDTLGESILGIWNSRLVKKCWVECLRYSQVEEKRRFNILSCILKSRCNYKIKAIIYWPGSICLHDFNYS